MMSLPLMEELSKNDVAVTDELNVAAPVELFTFNQTVPPLFASFNALNCVVPLETSTLNF